MDRADKLGAETILLTRPFKSTDLITAQAMVLKGPDCREFKGYLIMLDPGD